MNRARPIPIGAMNVARCFSAASMRMVNTRSVVRNISMKSPWARFVPSANVVATVNFCENKRSQLVYSVLLSENGRKRISGNNTFTIPALVMAPTICAMVTTAARVYVRQPTSVKARVTAGLNSPPLIRKNTHAQTARLNPNDNEIYSNAPIDGVGASEPVEASASFAT